MKGNANEPDIQTSSYVIILDDDVAAYLDQQGITDVNGYINGLLEQAMQGESGRQPLETLNRNTPDTSGYPEMEGHFADGGA